MAAKKRKGPGGPNRSSGRVTPKSTEGSVASPSALGDETARTDGPPPAALVDLVLNQFADVLPPDTPDPQHVAEIWADEFLGPADPSDPKLAAALTDLADGLRDRADGEADLVLAGLARVASSRGIDLFTEAWAERLRDPLVDLRAAALGEDRLGEAIEITHPTGDGVTLVVGVTNPAGDYSVGVYLDQNLGGIAVDVLIGPPLDEVRDLYDPESNDDDFSVLGLDPAEMARRVARGMALTERMTNAPIGDDFLALVPFVARRLDLLPRRALAPAATHLADRVPDEDRATVVEAFAASPEASQLSEQERAAGEALVDAWTDHLARHTLGGLHRVSALLVEQFCLGHLQTLPLARDEAVRSAAPTALAAWIRFAARTSGLPDRWRDEALDSLERCTPTLRSGASPDDAPPAGG